ncbi:hypothetical protein Vi05172_g1889 [Venturia inaequalis]|nr:hypothetical protein Vi05172_g1889 [Venturia inaequalis]
MKWRILLFIGALWIIVCAAADHNQLMQNQGKAIWQDLKAGKVTQNPAPPVLTQEGREYAAKVMRSYAQEENTFKILEDVLIQGEHDQKKWNKTVDQWVHDFEDAVHSRPLPSSQKTAISDLISTTKKVLHAINEIVGTGQKSTTGLDVRQSVGILLSDHIESLRVEVSPYGPEQNTRTEKANMENLRQRQLEMVTIVRGVFEQIPEALSLLDEAVIEIVGRNEKERGTDYFMKHYAPNKNDGTSKKNIKRINGLYKDQQKKSIEDREKSYVHLMDTLLRRLETSDQSVPGQHHGGIVVPEQPAIVPTHTESTLVAPETPTTNVSNATAPVTPPTTTSTTSNSTQEANSTSTTVSPTQTYETVVVTVHPIVTVIESVTATVHSTVTATETPTTTVLPTATATVHPTVTATETPTTTVLPTVTATATVLSNTVEPPIANVSATSITNHLWTRGIKQERKEKEDDGHKKELAIGLGTGLPAFTAGAGWAAYKTWKAIDYTRKISTIKSAAQAIQEAADLLAEQLSMDKATAIEQALVAKKAAEAMKTAERLGQLRQLNRLGGDLFTIFERSPSAETGSYHTAAEELVGEVAQMALNEAGRDLARAGQLTESAVAGLGKAVPNLFSWLLDQTAGLGDAALDAVKDAIVNAHVHRKPAPREAWSDAGTGIGSGNFFDNTDLLFGPAFRALQGMSEIERVKAYKKDVEKWRQRQWKSESSESKPETKGQDAPKQDDASNKESATTRPQEKPSPTASTQPTQTGLQAPGQHDKISNGSDTTRTPESTPAPTNSGSTIPTLIPAANSTSIIPSNATSLANSTLPTGNTTLIPVPTSNSTLSPNATSTPIPTQTQVPKGPSVVTDPDSVRNSWQGGWRPTTGSGQRLGGGARMRRLRRLFGKGRGDGRPIPAY